jgi:tripartite-type tricarboxylate transporter receptor subunit TctC
LLSAFPAAQAQTRREIDQTHKILVSTRPGQAADVTATRCLRARRCQNLSQPVIIENRPGAAATGIAAEAAARPIQDGTLNMSTSLATSCATDGASTRRLPFPTWKTDFRPIALTAIPDLLVVSPRSSGQQYAELIAWLTNSRQGEFRLVRSVARRSISLLRLTRCWPGCKMAPHISYRSRALP